LPGYVKACAHPAAGRPDDYVIATGETHAVREFVEKAFKQVDIEVVWEGKGTGEGIVSQKRRRLVEIDPRYFRPTGVDCSWATDQG